MHQVTVSNGSVVTVPVFNVKSVLLSILHDPQRMRNENFALNYDVFLGSQHKLLQIMMKFIWAIYCQLLVISNAVMIKNHFRWVLSVFMTKLILMYMVHQHLLHLLHHFRFFNKTCRNNHKFYSVLGYDAPNFSYGYGKSTSKKAVDKLITSINAYV